MIKGVCRTLFLVLLVLSLQIVTIMPAAAQVSFEYITNFSSIAASGPLAGVVIGGDGAFYGTASQGGAGQCGLVYRLGSDGTLTVLHTFIAAQGCTPVGDLALGPDGALYGVTYGGSMGGGTIYKVALDGTFTLLRTVVGELLYAGLTLGPDGLLYGTSMAGTVFSMSSDGDFNVIVPPNLATFQSQAALTMSSEGMFYGTRYTSQVGTPGGAGAVFRVTLAGDLTSYEFPFVQNALPAICPNGAGILGEVVEGPDQNFYGTTSSCGPAEADRGTVFRITPTGVITTLHTFSPDPTTLAYSEGSDAWAGLTLASDGYLYGMTTAGGIFHNGVIFRISLEGTYTVLHHFDGSNGGGSSESKFLEASPGIFYATSSNAVFRLTVAANMEPTAADGAISLLEDQPATGTLNAIDDDNDDLTFSIVANGALGSATIIDPSTGAFIYTPSVNAYGTDSFTFLANDGAEDSNVATVNVTIAPVNDAPIANNGILSAVAGTPVNGTLVATDVDNAALTYGLVTNGAKGVAVVTNSSTGDYTYTPNVNATGNDTLTFKATDNDLVESNEASVTVTITQPVLTCAADITPTIALSQGSPKLDRRTGRYSQTVTLRNSDGPASGPVSLVLDNLSLNAILVNGNGTTTCASPLGSSYIHINVGSDALFNSRERATVQLLFNNPTGQPITYTPRVLAGLMTH